MKSYLVQKPFWVGGWFYDSRSTQTFGEWPDETRAASIRERIDTGYIVATGLAEVSPDLPEPTIFAPMPASSDEVRAWADFPPGGGGEFAIDHIDPD